MVMGVPSPGNRAGHGATRKSLAVTNELADGPRDRQPHPAEKVVQPTSPKAKARDSEQEQEAQTQVGTVSSALLKVQVTLWVWRPMYHPEPR